MREVEMVAREEVIRVDLRWNSKLNDLSDLTIILEMFRTM